MIMRNAYTLEDRILAYTMFRNGKMEIGLWDIKRIAQVSGHSIDSLKMKVDQFKGIVGERYRQYIEDRDHLKPGLNEWAETDERVHADHKNIDMTALINISKVILAAKFKRLNNLTENKRS
jgi:hypothetical protein